MVPSEVPKAAGGHRTSRPAAGRVGSRGAGPGAPEVARGSGMSTWVQTCSPMIMFIGFSCVSQCSMFEAFLLECLCLSDVVLRHALPSCGDRGMQSYTENNVVRRCVVYASDCAVLSCATFWFA